MNIVRITSSSVKFPVKNGALLVFSDNCETDTPLENWIYSMKISSKEADINDIYDFLSENQNRNIIMNCLSSFGIGMAMAIAKFLEDYFNFRLRLDENDKNISETSEMDVFTYRNLCKLYFRVMHYGKRDIDG